MFKNKLAYLLFLLAAALFAILYNVYFTGILFLAAVLLPVVLLLLLLITFFGISVEMDTDVSTAEKGENLSLNVTIRNKSIFPVPKLRMHLIYSNELSKIVYKEKISLSLDQRSSKTVAYHMISDYCGIFRFRIKNIRLYDYFLLWSLKKRAPKDLRIPVIPRKNLLTADLIRDNSRAMDSGEWYSVTKSGNDPSEVFDIREYREGDRPHSIHWKLSYRQDQLMVKEYSEPMNYSIFLLLELPDFVKGEEGLRVLDALLECAMSLSYSCCLNGHSHRLLWYDEEQGGCRQELIREEEELYSVMERLLKAGLPKNGHSIIEECNALLLKESYTHMIYITSRLREDELYEWVNSRELSVYYLFYVNDRNKLPLSGEMKQLLGKLQIIYYEMDLETVQSSLLSLCFT